MLGVGVARRNLLVPGTHPWEILFSLGLLFELSHINGQLGAEHTVKTAFSAALHFYLLQQREMRESQLHSRSQKPQKHQNVRGRGLSVALTQRKKKNSRSPSEKDINMKSREFDSWGLYLIRNSMQQRNISNTKKQSVASFISTSHRGQDLTCVLLSRSKPRLDSLFFLLWLSPPPPRSSGVREWPAPIDLPSKQGRGIH